MKQVRLMASPSSLGETKPDSLSGIEVVGLILEAPTADVMERKYGEWIYLDDGEYRCFVCGWEGTVCCEGKSKSGEIESISAPTAAQ